MACLSRRCREKYAPDSSFRGKPLAFLVFQGIQAGAAQFCRDRMKKMFSSPSPLVFQISGRLAKNVLKTAEPVEMLVFSSFS
jgi:hypothetical protein